MPALARSDAHLLKTAAKTIGISGIVAALALSGCTGNPQTTSPTNPDSSTASAVSGPGPASPEQRRKAGSRWSVRLDVLGQPVEADGTLLVMARTPSGGVEVVGLDAGTGAERWRRPFHPAYLPTGISLEPRVTRDSKDRPFAVVRMRKHERGDYPVSLVDVRNGRIVDQAQLLMDDYGPCSDGQDVCTSGSSYYTNGYPTGDGPMRWDIETGRIAENGRDGALKVGDPDLYVSGQGRMTDIVRLRGMFDSLWSQPVSLVVREGGASRYGWSFTHDPEADVYVGSLGAPQPKRLVREFRAGNEVGWPLSSKYVTVGLDGRTGERLWRKEGADPWCGLVRGFEHATARALCVLDGVSVHQDGRDVRYRDLTVTLMGIDPRTGDETWSRTLTGREAERSYVDGAPLAPYGVVIEAKDGPVALDLRDGTTQVVDPRTVLLCDGGPARITVYGQDRAAGTLYRPCRPDGSPAKGAPSVFGVTALQGEGDPRYLAMPGRVVAYDVG